MKYDLFQCENAGAQSVVAAETGASLLQCTALKATDPPPLTVERALLPI